MRKLTLYLFLFLLLFWSEPAGATQPVPTLKLKSPIVHRYMSDAAIVFTWLDHGDIDQSAGWVLSCDDWFGRVIKPVPQGETDVSFVYWPLGRVTEAWLIAGYDFGAIPECADLPELRDSYYFDFSSFITTGTPGATPDSFMVNVFRVNPQLSVIEAWIDSETAKWVRTCTIARPYSGSMIYYRPAADQELLPGDRPDLYFAYYHSPEVIEVWVAAGEMGTTRPPCFEIHEYTGAVRVTFNNRSMGKWRALIQ